MRDKVSAQVYGDLASSRRCNVWHLELVRFASDNPFCAREIVSLANAARIDHNCLSFHENVAERATMHARGLRRQVNAYVWEQHGGSFIQAGLGE